jgi:hypothetical protein
VRDGERDVQLPLNRHLHHLAPSPGANNEPHSNEPLRGWKEDWRVENLRKIGRAQASQDLQIEEMKPAEHSKATPNKVPGTESRPASSFAERDGNATLSVVHCRSIVRASPISSIGFQ